MKKAILILMLIPILAQGQGFKELILKYEIDCNEIVKDTIKQQGIVEYKHVPVKDSDGNIMHYVIGKSKTTWKEPQCNEYKYDERTIFIGNFNVSMSPYITVDTSGELTISEVINPIKTSIERDYVCDCKKRKIHPFSKHFWNWIKEN